ncbi:MAG: ATP-binding cassette domain-containing protein [Deltaproteobacteria bacterium]|nr:ATP-binding cassette domain-containing protein [Deltaproteobacteria bacterium]
MTKSVVELSEVFFRRDGLNLLSGVNWTIKPGQHWALLGPNGAGKTLILRMINGYIWPTDGHVSVLGHRLGEVDLRELRKRIGWVSQALADVTPGYSTVFEVILSGPKATLGLYSEPEPEQRQKAEDLAKEFGLIELLARPFAHLSSGERQRALLARAALAEPSLLILDEPMSNLDMGGRELFLNLVTKVAERSKATTIILTTHNITEIGSFITDACLIKKGRVVNSGALDLTLTEGNLSLVFDLPLKLERTSQGRYLAWLE